MKKIITALIAFSTSALYAQQGNVGINTTTPKSTLDVVGNPTDTSHFDGIIAPRITGNQLRAKTYTSNQTGALVYVTVADSAPAGQTIDVTTAGYYFFDGTKWIVVKAPTSSNNDWALLGNAGTTTGTNFIGTTDLAEFHVRTNNIIRERTFEQAKSWTSGPNIIKTIEGGDLEVNQINVGHGGGDVGTNTSVGGAALMANTTGWGNTAVGLRAMVANTTGTTNTALGVDALRKNTTGEANSALSMNALYNNTTGGSNTAVGRDALGGNISGSQNTAIGTFSLTRSEGNLNTALGYLAGTLPITGNNNILIGANTELGTGTVTDSNLMNIGNAIFGVGMNGTFSAPAGNIGILTTAPTGVLDVVSPNGQFVYGNTGATLIKRNAANILTLQNSLNNTSGYSFLNFRFGNASGIGASINGTGNASNGLASLSFNINSIEAQTIISNGNIGMGTNAPSTTLHVYKASSPAVRIEDGTQGVNKVLTSDASGNASWQTANISVIQGVLPATGPTFTSAANQDLAVTGGSISLPPGKWLVAMGTTAALTDAGAINQDGQLWLAASLSSTSGGTTISADVDTSATATTGRRISGSLGRGENKTSISGYITVTNSTAANKTYYLFVSEEWAGTASKPTKSTGGTAHWGNAFASGNWERFFYAIPTK